MSLITLKTVILRQFPLKNAFFSVYVKTGLQKSNAKM